MAEKSSFIKLNRNILQWGWYKNANTFRVFIHLLITANIRANTFEGILIKRGEVATSVFSLAENLGLTEKQVRTALSHLKSTGEISSRRGSRYQILRVENYDKYQSMGNQMGNQKAFKGHSKGDNQRNKEINNPLVSYETSPHGGGRESAKTDFLTFWEKYPKKVDQERAKREWDRLRLDSGTVEEILQAIAQQSRTKSWQEEQGRFIPSPAKWLNGKRWRDKLELPARENKSYNIDEIEAFLMDDDCRQQEGTAI